MVRNSYNIPTTTYTPKQLFFYQFFDTQVTFVTVYFIVIKQNIGIILV